MVPKSVHYDYTCDDICFILIERPNVAKHIVTRTSLKMYTLGGHILCAHVCRTHDSETLRPQC